MPNMTIENCMQLCIDRPACRAIEWYPDYFPFDKVKEQEKSYFYNKLLQKKGIKKLE